MKNLIVSLLFCAISPATTLAADPCNLDNTTLPSQVQNSTDVNAATMCDGKIHESHNPFGPLEFIGKASEALTKTEPPEVKQFVDQMQINQSQAVCPANCTEKDESSQTTFSCVPAIVVEDSSCPQDAKPLDGIQSPSFVASDCDTSEKQAEAWIADVIKNSNDSGHQVAKALPKGCSPYWGTVTKTLPTSDGKCQSQALIHVDFKTAYKVSWLRAHFTASGTVTRSWSCTKK